MWDEHETVLAPLAEMRGESDFRLILLKRSDGSIRATAKVDLEDYEKVNRLRWHRHAGGYAAHTFTANGKRGTHLLHRLVLGLAPSEGGHVDHINGDRLDCRKKNLRVGTRFDNMQNRSGRRRRRGTSKYRGVYKDKRNYWAAQVRMSGKNHFLGYFETEELAGVAAARWRAENMPGTIEDEALLDGAYEDVPRSRAYERGRKARAERIQRLWAEGKLLREIADELGVKRVTLGSHISWMRKNGYDLPYRRGDLKA